MTRLLHRLHLKNLSAFTHKISAYILFASSSSIPSDLHSTPSATLLFVVVVVVVVVVQLLGLGGVRR